MTIDLAILFVAVLGAMAVCRPIAGAEWLAEA